MFRGPARPPSTVTPPTLQVPVDAASVSQDSFNRPVQPYTLSGPARSPPQKEHYWRSAPRRYHGRRRMARSVTSTSDSYSSSSSSSSSSDWSRKRKSRRHRRAPSQPLTYDPSVPASQMYIPSKGRFVAPKSSYVSPAVAPYVQPASIYSTTAGSITSAPYRTTATEQTGTYRPTEQAGSYVTHSRNVSRLSERATFQGYKSPIVGPSTVTLPPTFKMTPPGLIQYNPSGYNSPAYQQPRSPGAAAYRQVSQPQQKLTVPTAPAFQSPLAKSQQQVRAVAPGDELAAPQIYLPPEAAMMSNPATPPSANQLQGMLPEQEEEGSHQPLVEGTTAGLAPDIRVDQDDSFTSFEADSLILSRPPSGIFLPDFRSRSRAKRKQGCCDAI
eukprot:Protomagalhaensia_sp_Gyna_25__1652@NODE_1859_length_1465_cov_91_695652_g1528_i0_p1_GENE_NODE_1859_length_1465_cov_91_695652_g1528_i0NODE_1859_length_1465_cov_91_695652_g1528_i0_p1_ORF_typecomplete_len385_score43_68SR25/PF10500_9/0_082IMUP/PF15761_5/0_11_NODE_1859_length_1465_cov_91_695652_g1528_i0811235